LPTAAGIYFNKIQCFCFEEQRLRAGEEIDMPVFFFLDPEMLDDPAMDNVSDITLSYTFFKTGEEVPVLEADEDEDSSEVPAAGLVAVASVQHQQQQQQQQHSGESRAGAWLRWLLRRPPRAAAADADALAATSSSSKSSSSAAAAAAAAAATV
jgi:Cytochrome c oxidase assembly protein CtaG/Cox11